MNHNTKYQGPWTWSPNWNAALIDTCASPAVKWQNSSFVNKVYYDCVQKKIMFDECCSWKQNEECICNHSDVLYNNLRVKLWDLVFREAAQRRGQRDSNKPEVQHPTLWTRVWRHNQSQSFARNFKHFQIGAALPKWACSAKFVNKIVPFVYTRVKFHADGRRRRSKCSNTKKYT